MYCTTVKKLLKTPQNKEALDSFEKSIFKMACDIYNEEYAKLYAAAIKNDVARGLDVFADVFDGATSNIQGTCDVIKIAAARSAAQHFVDTCDSIGKQLKNYQENCDMFLGFGKDCVAVVSTMVNQNLVKNQSEGKGQNNEQSNENS